MSEVYVIAYEHVDFTDLIFPVSRATSLLDEQLLPCIEEDARLAFEQAGWEGDGSLGIIWLPPFVFADAEEVRNEGECLWHVKQGSNGTSWLLASRCFKFPFVDEREKEWKTIQLHQEPLHH